MFWLWIGKLLLLAFIVFIFVQLVRLYLADGDLTLMWAEKYGKPICKSLTLTLLISLYGKYVKSLNPCFYATKVNILPVIFVATIFVVLHSQWEINS